MKFTFQALVIENSSWVLLLVTCWIVEYTNLDEYITVSASMWLGTSSFRKKKQMTQQKESASVLVPKVEVQQIRCVASSLK